MKLKHIIPIIATAVTLALAFPKASLWPLAYVGLVPFLLWSRNRSPREHFWGGSAAGFLFYGIVFSWFASLTYWVGSIALVGVGFLLALFSLLWGLVWLAKNYVEKVAPWTLAAIFPALWVLLEYAENHLFTGFGWGSLGYTQWKNLPVAQLASFGSIYLVGFFIVLINTLVYQVVVSIRAPKRFLPPALIAILLGAAVPLWGARQMGKPDMTSSLKVGVIQPNFSLDVKWNGEYAAHMLSVQEELTNQVVAEGAEFVVWPESALYGYLVNEREKIAKTVREHDIYLLMGSNHYEYTGSQADENVIYFNSAFLLDPEGRILGRYDKRHLAPFGEYVPLASLIGFVGKVVPAISDFTPGENLTCFEIGDKKFAVLICFENSFPHVVHEAAQGVDFLVQITNDGWFGRSAQPWQDLAIAVFRSIENGMTLIRGTNTGVSCFIDPWGRVSGMVRNYWDEAVFSRGIAQEPISTVAHDTFHRTHGDIFALACAAFIVLFGAFAFYQKRYLPKVIGNGGKKKKQKRSELKNSYGKNH